MPGIGDSSPRNYVTQELIRRTIGMSGRRSDSQGSQVCGIENLKNWHNTKRPWVRLVSNAVPVGEYDGNPEWKLAQQVYNETPSETTRFRHVMWGGTGQYDQAEKRVNLAHTFDEQYVNPFQIGGLPPAGEGAQLKRNYKPMPGITDVNVTYKGDMGALKKASIAFKCYTLQDLERLEKLYMYPGIKLLLEWGWSINTADEAAERASNEIKLVELDNEVLKDPNQVYNAISTNRVLSGGCYDGMFGTVVNFSWSVNADLSFDCKTDITDFGDSIFTINTNTPFKAGSSDFSNKDGLTLYSALEDIHKNFSKKGKNNQISEESITLDQIGLFKAKIFKMKSGTTSKAVGDKNKTERQKHTYIRFGDIVDVLLNKLYGLTSESTRGTAPASNAIALFSIGGTEADRSAGLSNGAVDTRPSLEDGIGVDTTGVDIPMRPIAAISNHKNLISVDPDVCLLPNQIGGEPYKVVDASKKLYGTSNYVPTGLKGEGCDFNIPKSIADLLYVGGDYKRESENGAGFLANIFVNFDILLEYSETANSVQSFLDSVTTEINNACGKVWAFQWRMLDEYMGYMTCIDRNFNWSGKVEALELSVDSQASLLKSLSMQSSISNQMKNALYIAANGPFTGEDVKIGEIQNKNIIPVNVDMSLDGISGIQYGTSFSVDYMPSRYQNQAYLFASNIQHNINATSWETTITANFRWAPLEDSLRKIKLKNIVPSETNDATIIIASTEAIQGMITEDNEVQEDGNQKEKVYGNEGVYPSGIFRSAESIDLVMGGTGADPESGMPVTAVTEKQEAKVDNEKVLSDRLARLYYKGSNDSDVAESVSILRDLLYKVPEKGGAAAAKADETVNEEVKKTVVKHKKVKNDTDFTKVMGSSTYDGATDVVKPKRVTYKGMMPPGFTPPPPSQTSIGPG